MLLKNKNDFRIITFLSIIFVLFLFNISFAEGTEETLSSQPITSIRCNTFTFDATGSYDPDNEQLSFQWDFGDGTSSTQPIAEHTYKKAGDYPVKLSISDNSGMECSVSTTSQMVRANIPPFATFDIKGEELCTKQTLILDAKGSYHPGNKHLSYSWDFGDGTTSTKGPKVSKTFSKGGTYKISLTITDGSKGPCSTQTVEKKVEINEAPLANAGTDEILKCVDTISDMVVQFDGSNSVDSNNDQLTYMWDFGDGNKANGIKVAHQYEKIDTYNAKLIVKDDSNLQCGTSVDFITVRLNKAPKANAGDDVIACPDEPIYFDGTKSFVDKKGTATGKWFFGDGETAQGFMIEHPYSKTGQYHASLTIENQLNAMCAPSRDTRLVTINSAPSVSIKSLDSVCLGSNVDFDASSASDGDGDSLEYYWSFGDGTILKGSSKASHQYNEGGDYRVTIIVDDGKETSCSTGTDEKYIKVNTPPVADAGADLACCVGLTSKFDASASSDPDNDHLTYMWDFGDGTTVNGMKVSHVYSKSGIYNVTLTVDDNSGSSCSKSTAGFTANVNAKPVPIITIR